MYTIEHVSTSMASVTTTEASSNSVFTSGGSEIDAIVVDFAMASARRGAAAWGDHTIDGDRTVLLKAVTLAVVASKPMHPCFNMVDNPSEGDDVNRSFDSLCHVTDKTSVS
jgi:hypothetical protein